MMSKEFWILVFGLIVVTIFFSGLFYSTNQNSSIIINEEQLNLPSKEIRDFQYLESDSQNPAQSGKIRLGNNEKISWRSWTPPERVGATDFEVSVTVDPREAVIWSTSAEKDSMIFEIHAADSRADLILFANHATPTNFDQISAIQFKDNNNKDGTGLTYSRIIALIRDSTANSIDGILQLDVASDNTLLAGLLINGQTKKVDVENDFSFTVDPKAKIFFDGGFDSSIRESKDNQLSIELGGNDEYIFTNSSMDFNLNRLTKVGNPIEGTDGVSANILGLLGNLVTTPCNDGQILKFQSANNTWICTYESSEQISSSNKENNESLISKKSNLKTNILISEYVTLQKESSNFPVKSLVDGKNMDYLVIDFNFDEEGTAIWQWEVPEDINSYQNITVKIRFEVIEGDTGSGVCFKGSWRGISDSETIDGPFLPLIPISNCDTSLNPGSLQSITLNFEKEDHGLKAGEFAFFKLTRDVVNSLDNYNEIARVIDLRITYIGIN